MKLSYKMQLCCFLVNVIIGIGLIWMFLEYLIYGEIQPRIVDDIINIFYMIAIIGAYFLGHNHGYNNANSAAHKDGV